MTTSPFQLLQLKALCDGLRRGLTGVDYCRFREWPLAQRLLQCFDEARVLDVGSGDSSFFPLLISLDHVFDLTVLDYSDPMTILKKRFLTLQEKGRTQVHPSFIHGDIRDLKFPDEHFDRISCVSTIEHIPAEGDSQGVKELARVLKPGGRLVLTVPMTKTNRDEFKMEEVYERSAPNEPVFFQRLYDFNTLQQRLILPSGLKLTEETFLFEPNRPYFWEQDCYRTEQNGRIILSRGRSHSRLNRALNVFRANSYIQEGRRSQAEQFSDKLIVGAVVLEKEVSPSRSS